MRKIRGNTVGTTMNPNQVAKQITCEDIGAVTLEQLLEVNVQIQGVDEMAHNNAVDIAVHTNTEDNPNPHEITCEKIGAVSEDSLIRQPDNLYQGEILEGGYYTSSGVWKESTSYKYAILPVGAVKNGDTLTFSKDFPYYSTSYDFSFFKADGTWITNRNLSSYGTLTVSLDESKIADGFYMAMRIRAAHDETKLVIVNDGILEPMPYFEYLQYLQKKANPIIGKVFNCIGDSFTSPATSWCKQLEDRVGCICNNYGVGSSRIGVDSPSGVLSFLNRYAEMDTSADATIIFGGINDAGALGVNGYAVGNIDSEPNTETFYGALKLLIANIKAHMPGKKIIGVIPPDFTPSYDSSLAIVQNACREVYESFAIPYADLKKDCQEMFRDDYNVTTYRKGTSDYHPSVPGQVAISEVIQGTLEKYIKV